LRQVSRLFVCFRMSCGHFVDTPGLQASPLH
jgi:hypothetical protein